MGGFREKRRVVRRFIIFKEWAEMVSASFRNYFTSIATAKKEFVLSTLNDNFTYVASVSTFEE